MIESKDKYFEVLNDIKKTLIVTRNRIVENANRDLVLMYYNIGLKLIENNKWGSSFIDTLAKDLKVEFPTLKGMSARNLRYMQKFATEFANDEFLQGVLAKLSWNHNQILLDKVKNKEIRKWYAKESLENGWSVSILIHQISSKLYERQALLENKTTNFDNTLPSPNNEQVKELLKNPYIFDFITADKDLKELDIERELTANITKLLLELGNGFAFVGRQYHLEIENEDYYIDLLFYNLKVRSYVVIELKTTEFKPEYTGKLNFYLNAVDKYIKGKNDNPTFGILLCKDKKRVTAELALKDINKPIGVSEYKILSEIPDYLENTLPSMEDIEKRLN
ncbi:MAG: PDDEXK nuclease domain-containing protein [bacterium]|nr:PDDEXK nuclease domain-containing protein [bacterium]